MIKRIVCLLTVASLLVTASCKDADAASKIDPTAQEVAPASPDAVIVPEPNIAPPPTPVEAESRTAETPAPAPAANGKTAIMSFAKSEHDFGTIAEGDKVDYTFAFKNTGKSDLIISNAVGSCGCTVPEFPKDPIKPGASGKIKVSFNSAGKPGQQQKTVTITANTPSGTEKLNIKASVTPKAGA
jgi:hypothetical protein